MDAPLPDQVTFYILLGTEYRRTWNPDRTVCLDEVVTPAIQATQDYINFHAADEAVPVAAQDTSDEVIVPEPTETGDE